jgi:hypothetical protein
VTDERRDDAEGTQAREMRAWERPAIMVMKAGGAAFSGDTSFDGGDSFS